MAFRSFHVAIGCLRVGQDILLVEQQGRDDPSPYWVLPGGLVEEGELLIDALRREVEEETGLQIVQVKQLIYCTHILHPHEQRQTIAFVFDVERWAGNLGQRDPDREVRQVAWTPFVEALVKLEAIGWRGMREPLLAYLKGKTSAGTIWFYRDSGDDQQLVSYLPS